MSREELSAFVSGCHVFKNHLRSKDVVDMIFDEANDEHAGMGYKGAKLPDNADDNPDSELMRFEFVETLVKLSQVRFSDEGVELEHMSDEAYREHRLAMLRLGGSKEATDHMKPPGGNRVLGAFHCKASMSETTGFTRSPCSYAISKPRAFIGRAVSNCHMALPVCPPN